MAQLESALPCEGKGYEASPQETTNLIAGVVEDKRMLVCRVRLLNASGVTQRKFDSSILRSW